MRKIKLDLYESPLPLENVNNLWADVNENTGDLRAIHRYNKSSREWEPYMVSVDYLNEGEEPTVGDIYVNTNDIKFLGVLDDGVTGQDDGRPVFRLNIEGLTGVNTDALDYYIANGDKSFYRFKDRRTSEEEFNLEIFVESVESSYGIFGVPILISKDVNVKTIPPKFSSNYEIVAARGYVHLGQEPM